MTAMPEEDEFTRLESADFPRIDLVQRGANGIPRFLIAKQDGAAGLLDAEFVRDLIAKAEPDPGGKEETVTLSGSPAAVARTFAEIHKAAERAAAEAAEIAKAAAEYEAVIKAKYSADDKRKMLAAGHAIKNDAGDPAYPIGDADDLDKAIHAVGRGGPDHDRIRAYVIRRAKALGKSSMIPDNWAADGSLKQKVSKDMADPVSKDAMAAAGDAMPLDGGMDGMDPTVPLCEPDEMGPGDPTDPGSPAWESIDAATAMKWTSIAARLKNALGMLAEREMLEAASADPSDAMNAMDLEDAMCAVDFAIERLAVFAAGEQAEAELGAEMEAMCKALAGSVAPLGVIEGLSAVRKAGRVLSTANEAAIRGAVESLQKVLASLPEAPVAKQASQEVGAVSGTQTAGDAPAQAVAKETAAPEEQARDAGPVNAGGTTGLGEPRMTGTASSLPGDGPQQARPGDAPGRTIVKSALALVFDRDRSLVGVTDAAAIVTQVAKADDGEKKPMQAVFDQNGDLIGIVDPDAIMPVTGAGKPPADDGDGMDGDGMQDGPAAAAADDMTPQPSADAGTPADEVGKAAGEDVVTVGADVLESIVAKAVAAALGAQPPAQDIAKQADVAGALAEVELLKARLKTVEETPAAPKVFTNGAVPPAHQLRGQDQGAGPQIDVAKALGRKHELYNAPDAASQNRLAQEMQGDAIAALAAIHRR